jgi:hypothetical protein
MRTGSGVAVRDRSRWPGSRRVRPCVIPIPRTVALIVSCGRAGAGVLHPRAEAHPGRAAAPLPTVTARMRPSSGRRRAGTTGTTCRRRILRPPVAPWLLVQSSRRSRRAASPARPPGRQREPTCPRRASPRPPPPDHAPSTKVTPRAGDCARRGEAEEASRKTRRPRLQALAAHRFGIRPPPHDVPRCLVDGVADEADDHGHEGVEPRAGALLGERTAPSNRRRTAASSSMRLPRDQVGRRSVTAGIGSEAAGVVTQERSSSLTWTRPKFAEVTPQQKRLAWGGSNLCRPDGSGRIDLAARGRGSGRS